MWHVDDLWYYFKIPNFELTPLKRLLWSIRRRLLSFYEPICENKIFNFFSFFSYGIKDPGPGLVLDVREKMDSVAWMIQLPTNLSTNEKINRERKWTDRQTDWQKKKEYERTNEQNSSSAQYCLKKKSKLTGNSLAEKCWAFLNKFQIVLSHHTLCHVGVITKNSEFLVLVDP